MKTTLDALRIAIAAAIWLGALQSSAATNDFQSTTDLVALSNECFTLVTQFVERNKGQLNYAGAMDPIQTNDWSNTIRSLHPQEVFVTHRFVMIILPSSDSNTIHALIVGSPDISNLGTSIKFKTWTNGVYELFKPKLVGP